MLILKQKKELIKLSGGRGGRGREPVDPLAKARKTGGIIAPKENKVTTYDDSSDDE